MARREQPDHKIAGLASAEFLTPSERELLAQRKLPPPAQKRPSVIRGQEDTYLRPEIYPKTHRHVVEWMLIALLLRGAYDVLKVIVVGHP